MTGTLPAAAAGPAATAVPRPAPFVLGGPPLARPTWRSTLAWVLLLAGFLLPIPGLFRFAGSTMEEGFMLVFPERLLAGDLPNVDFLHLYGPGSIQVLAGWYAVFGHSLGSERVAGVLQLLGAAVAMYALCRPWGYRAAVPATLTLTALMVTPTGLAALAWPGALALGLGSIALGVRVLHTAGRARTTAAAAGGVLAGLALAYRPDLVLAVGLAWAVLAWRSPARRATLAGAVVGLVPMWVHLAAVGIGPAWRGMVRDPVFELRPGRRLPVPPTWGELDGALQALTENPVEAPWWRLPSLSASHQLFVWFLAVVVAAAGVVVVAAVWWRRRGPTGPVVLYTAVALFGAGLVGQAAQRPDSTHLAWGSAVTFPMLAVLAVEATGAVRGADAWRRLAPAAGLAVVLLVVCPLFTLRPYLFAARVTLGDRTTGFRVDGDGRHFVLPNAATQEASQAAVDLVRAEAKPGERLLVGPADLSRTVYSDVMFYYLLPDLEPATYYIEMDPGLADDPGSGLADDVASADWLILTNFWTGWYEPNASTEPGSTRPNEIVASDFCLAGDFDDGLVLVFRRCEQGDGLDPSTIGIGPARRAVMEAEKARRGG